MSPDEFADKMRELSEDDPEVGHIKADELMIDVLKSLGYADGANIFEHMEKWYA